LFLGKGRIASSCLGLLQNGFKARNISGGILSRAHLAVERMREKEVEVRAV
jgi:hypothetical protein